MYANLLIALVEQPSTVLTIYWGCLIIGGGLILVSMIGAIEHGAAVDADAGMHVEVDADADFDLDSMHAEADFGVDAGHAEMDIGADAGHVEFDGGLDAAHGGLASAGHATGGAAAVANWFSLRFLVFFAAMFGATGVIFSYLSDWNTKPVLIVALLSGLLVGQGVHQIFRLIRRTSGDSTPRTGDYVNRRASVTIPIAPVGPGEIAVEVRGTQRFLPATATGDMKFKAGDEVVVVGYRAGVAQVISLGEYERQYRSQQGDQA